MTMQVHECTGKRVAIDKAWRSHMKPPRRCSPCVWSTRAALQKDGPDVLCIGWAVDASFDKSCTDLHKSASMLHKLRL